MQNEMKLSLLNEEQLDSVNGGVWGIVVAIVTSAVALGYVVYRDGLSDGRELAQGK